MGQQRSNNVILRIAFAADPTELKNVRDAVKQAVQSEGCSERCVNELVLAVNEACMNIMQHAYKGDCSGQIELSMSRDGRELKVDIVDYADPVDLTRISPRDLDDIRPGGLGTHFIHEIMDDCQYGHRDGDCGNFVKMKKKIDKAS